MRTTRGLEVMDKRITKGLVVFISSIMLLAFLFPYQAKLEELNNVTFDVASSSQLYFRNTRAFYYELEEMPDAGFNVYKFGNTLKVDSIAYLNFFIVHNWRQSEAYLMTRVSPKITSNTLRINAADTSFVLLTDQMKNTDYYHFGGFVFEKLLNSEDLILASTGNSIFGTEENKQQNLKVLKDYFKLIGKYY